MNVKIAYYTRAWHDIPSYWGPKKFLCVDNVAFAFDIILFISLKNIIYYCVSAIVYRQWHCDISNYNKI